MAEQYDVAIVGGGPAGAATGSLLAQRGLRVVIFERHAASRWRACGVFASPLVRNRLRHLGLSRAEVAALHQPISSLELRSTRGVRCTLEYSAGMACGFDRVALDTRLLSLAADNGVEVRRSTVVKDIVLNGGRGTPEVLLASDERVSARVVVGADGGGSRVARVAGVASGRNWLGRSGITFHVDDPNTRQPTDTGVRGRFVFGNGWYVGLAPVPQGRVNVGMVVPTSRLADGVETVIASVLGAIPEAAGRWSSLPRTDSPQVAGRLEHHTSRAAGDGWLLVGDAIEFIDPLTGEGLQRALATADLAAEAIGNGLSGDRNAMSVYDRRVRSRFRSKNVFSLVLQAFLADPRVLDYALRRLDARPALRDEFTSVLTDQAPATKALDPRFMARLFAP